MTTSPGFCLIGIGDVFDMIAGDPTGYHLPDNWQARKADSVAALASAAEVLLEGLQPGATQLFLAVDQNAMNYARLEIYYLARLRGLRMSSLVHVRAFVAPNVRLDDNTWVGPGVLVGSGAHLASDVLVNPGARIDAGVHVGMHGWIGAGAVIGTASEIGNHCVVGADMRIAAGRRIGDNCVVDFAGALGHDLPSGSFSATGIAGTARIVGSGYTFKKRR